MALIPPRVRRPIPRGMNLSLPGDVVPPERSQWSGNVRFRFGVVRPSPGRDLWGNHGTSEAIYNLGTLVGIDGTKYPYKLTESGLYRWTGGAWSQVTGTTIGGSGRYGVTSGEGFLFFSRGATGIFKWNGGATYTTITASSGSVPAPRYLAYYNDRLLTAYNLESAADYVNRLRWAEPLDHTAWDPGAAGSETGAGFLDLAEGGTEHIRNIAPISGRVAILREHSLTDFYKTGILALPHRIESRVNGIGTGSPWSVVSTGMEVLFLGTDMNVWSWDGTQIQPVGDEIKEYLEAYITASTMGSVWASYLCCWREYWLVVSNTQAFVFDTIARTWSLDTFKDINALGVIELDAGTGDQYNDLIGTYDEQEGPFDQWGKSNQVRVIGGTSTGETFDLSWNRSWDYFATGSVILKWMDTYDMYLTDDPYEDNNTLQRVLIATATNDDRPFKVQISADRGITYNTFTVTPVNGYAEVNCNITGRAFRFRFREENNDSKFRWSHYSVEFVPRDQS